MRCDVPNCDGDIVIRTLCDSDIKIWRDGKVQAYSGSETINEFVVCWKCGKQFDVQIVDNNYYLGEEEDDET